MEKGGSEKKAASKQVSAVGTWSLPCRATPGVSAERRLRSTPTKHQETRTLTLGKRMSYVRAEQALSTEKLLQEIPVPSCGIWTVWSGNNRRAEDIWPKERLLRGPAT